MGNADRPTLTTEDKLGIAADVACPACGRSHEGPPDPSETIRIRCPCGVETVYAGPYPLYHVLQLSTPDPMTYTRPTYETLKLLSDTLTAKLNEAPETKP